MMLRLTGALKISAPVKKPMAGTLFASAMGTTLDRKSTRLNSSHLVISYAVFCLKKKKHSYIRHLSVFFFFNDTATTEIYTLFPTRRSSDLACPPDCPPGRAPHRSTRRGRG